MKENEKSIVLKETSNKIKGKCRVQPLKNEGTVFTEQTSRKRWIFTQNKFEGHLFASTSS